MHIVYLNLYSDIKSHDPESFFKSSFLPQPVFSKLSETLPQSLSIVQRAIFNATTIRENVNYYFIKDEFGTTLRWWQQPIVVFDQITLMKPEIIQVRGLDLPLQFRWLRRRVGNEIKIVGEHTGETIWINRKVWLQQFGLRVVDGFIFENINDAFPWTKASVILDRQPITGIDLSAKNPAAIANSLLKFYHTL